MTISESPVLANAYGDRSVDRFAGAVANLFGGHRLGTVPAFDPASRIALVRGFDRNSRSLRSALGEVAREHAGGLVEVAPIPSFGQIPEADDVSLVVVARDSLLAGAERCAAYWDALVIAPDELTAAGDVAVQTLPTLTVRRDETVDACGARLCFSDSVTVNGAQRAQAQFEPMPGGVRIDEADVPEAGTVVVQTHGPTMGSIDGEPQLFAEGRYEIGAGNGLRRIGPAA